MLNCVILMGRLTHHPELKSTGGGVSVCSFRLAVERRFKGQNEERQTDFIQCVSWRETAEFISRYFSKGSMLAVRGELQVRRYEDKNGNNREAVEVIVSQASFTGERRQDAPSGHDAPPPAPPLPNASRADFDEIGGDDDLPF